MWRKVVWRGAGRQLRWSSSAWQVLGLPAGSSRAQVKAAYYELAKRTHPDGQPAADASGSPPDTAQFLQVQAAFEELMEETRQPGPRVATSPNHAARGGAPPPRHAAERKARPSARVRTLGEVLCDQLEEEPGEARAVWEEIVARRLPVDAHVSDRLAKACGRSGLGMRGALEMLREGTRLGLMPQAVRSATIASIMCHCKEENLEVTFDLVADMTDEDRTPEVLSALSSTFSFFPSGSSF
ncbi:hypothetical protein AB1Y20_008148 [Prymnesium parvum]|uniref:J domain-containing protein n=1 Tax=Prymnesium parvum TaxID=97485 RepID=A0AB34ITX3_PRYPA